MRTSVHLALAALLGTSLILAGCGSDGAGPDPTPDEGAPSDGTVEEVTDDASAYDVEAIDLGEPGETDPGATLALGEAAWFVNEVTPSGSEETIELTTGLSLLQIEEGSPDIWADWENAEEFEGFTPYLMVIQYVYPDGLPEELDEPPAPAIFPLLEDGSGASFIEAQNFGMGAGASDECGYVLQGWDPESNTLVVCAVGLSDAGPVTGGLFNGDGWSSFVQGLDPVYGNNPIIWG